MTVPLPPLPPQSAITVRNEPDCLTVTWAGRRGFIRTFLGLPGRTEKLVLYLNRLVYSEWPHPRWVHFGVVMKVASRPVHPVVPDTFHSAGIPRDALGDVRLERSDEAVRLTVRYGVASRIEIGATLGDGDKAWLADVLRRWIAG